MITHPQKLPVLQHTIIWESRMQNAVKEESTADGALGCTASHTCRMFISVLAKFAHALAIMCKSLCWGIEASQQINTDPETPLNLYASWWLSCFLLLSVLCPYHRHTYVCSPLNRHPPFRWRTNKYLIICLLPSPVSYITLFHKFYVLRTCYSTKGRKVLFKIDVIRLT